MPIGVDADHRKGCDTGHSFLTGVRRILDSFGGDGDVGGVISSGRGRPSRLAITALRSGDLLKFSNVSPKESSSSSVTVSESSLRRGESSVTRTRRSKSSKSQNRVNFSTLALQTTGTTNLSRKIGQISASRADAFWNFQTVQDHG